MCHVHSLPVVNVGLSNVKRGLIFFFFSNFQQDTIAKLNFSGTEWSEILSKNPATHVLSQRQNGIAITNPSMVAAQI